MESSPFTYDSEVGGNPQKAYLKAKIHGDSAIQMMFFSPVFAHPVIRNPVMAVPSQPSSHPALHSLFSFLPLSLHLS
jgi:hypothetical protein